MTNEKVFATPIGKVYPLLVAKAERKGRIKAEADEVIRWLDKLVDDLAKGKPMEKVLKY